MVLTTIGEMGARIDTPEHHEEHFTGWEKYLNVSLDHKVIGVQYTVVALALISIGGLFALIFRTELAASELQFLTKDLQLFGQNGPDLYTHDVPAWHDHDRVDSPGISGIINTSCPFYSVPSIWLFHD